MFNSQSIDDFQQSDARRIFRPHTFKSGTRFGGLCLGKPRVSVCELDLSLRDQRFTDRLMTEIVVEQLQRRHGLVVQGS